MTDTDTTTLELTPEQEEVAKMRMHAMATAPLTQEEVAAQEAYLASKENAEYLTKSTEDKALDLLEKADPLLPVTASDLKRKIDALLIESGRRDEPDTSDTVSQLENTNFLSEEDQATLAESKEEPENPGVEEFSLPK